jgi:hypothetical protein
MAKKKASAQTNEISEEQNAANAATQETVNGSAGNESATNMESLVEKLETFATASKEAWSAKMQLVTEIATILVHMGGAADISGNLPETAIGPISRMQISVSKKGYAEFECTSNGKEFIPGARMRDRDLITLAMFLRDNLTDKA